MYAYIYMYKYIYTIVYICIYVYMYIYLCIILNICIYTLIWIYTKPDGPSISMYGRAQRTRGCSCPHAQTHNYTRTGYRDSARFLVELLEKKLRGHSAIKLHGNPEIVAGQEVGKWAPRAW